MAGLMNLGRGTAKGAMQGAAIGAESEYQRNTAQEQLNQAQDAARKSTMGTMAGSGAQFGMSDKGGEFIANTFGKGGRYDVAAKMGVDSVGLGTAGAAEGSAAAIKVGAQNVADGVYNAAINNYATESAAMTASKNALAEASAGTVAGAKAGVMGGPAGAVIGLAAGYLLTELF